MIIDLFLAARDFIRPKKFIIRVKNGDEYAKFEGRVPKNFETKEWCTLIKTKLDQYDLPHTYQYLSDMHTALAIWSLSVGASDDAKKVMESDPLPKNTLGFSHGLKASIERLPATHKMRQPL